MQECQRKSVGGLDGERSTALNQSRRGVVAVLGRLRSGGAEIGPRGLGVVGAIEVLGAKDRIACGEPLGGPAVQCAPPTLEQGRRKPRPGPGRA